MRKGEMFCFRCGREDVSVERVEEYFLCNACVKSLRTSKGWKEETVSRAYEDLWRESTNILAELREMARDIPEERFFDLPEQTLRWIEDQLWKILGKLTHLWEEFGTLTKTSGLLLWMRKTDIDYALFYTTRLSVYLRRRDWVYFKYELGLLKDFLERALKTEEQLERLMSV